MKQYRRANTLTSTGIYLRKRIANNSTRAKFVGIIYLLGIIALVVAACLPYIAHETLVSIGVMDFWKEFMPKNLKGFKLQDTDHLIKLTISALYFLMLLGLVVNVFKGLSKLGWLFKKRANNSYGFNRNVYAMDDLGRIFSSSFAVFICTYYIMCLLCGDMSKVDVSEWILVVLGAGIVLRLFLGFVGAKIAFYDIDRGEILEQKRMVGRFAPLVRNVFQFAAVGSIMFFMLRFNTMYTYIPEISTKVGMKDFLTSAKDLIIVGTQGLIVLCSFVLVKHAVNVTEYNPDGAHGAGMKNFRIFCFFICGIAVANILFNIFGFGNKTINTDMVCIAAIAFVMFVIELIMRRMPDYPTDKAAIEGEEEFSFDAIVRAQLQAQAQAQPQILAKHPNTNY